jgi:hypothetical protein
MNKFALFNKPSKYRIVAMYRYTSVVQDRILEQNHNYKQDTDVYLDEFYNEILRRALANGCKDDNKIVFELAIADNNPNVTSKSSNLFIGKYDGKVAMGLTVMYDSWVTSQLITELIPNELDVLEEDLRNEIELNS